MRTRDPEFAPIAACARQVMATSGVRRTPIHLEGMVDENGPCLLEVGARLVGGDPALDPWLHDLDLSSRTPTGPPDPYDGTGDDAAGTTWLGPITIR